MAKKKDDSPLNIFLMTIWALITSPYYLIKAILGLKPKAEEKDNPPKRAQKEPAEYRAFTILETEKGDLLQWESKLMQSESQIGIILGARGSGKSAIGMSLLENMYNKTGRRCYALGFNREDLPGWIDVVEDVAEIKNGALVLIDEGGILFSSRKSMTKPNQYLSELILISRHKSISILFISQNSSNLEVNVLRQADYLLMKPSSLMQLDFERKKIKDIYTDAKAKFEQYSQVKGLTYIYSEGFTGFVTNRLPSFWDSRISKSFKGKTI